MKTQQIQSITQSCSILGLALGCLLIVSPASADTSQESLRFYDNPVEVRSFETHATTLDFTQSCTSRDRCSKSVANADYARLTQDEILEKRPRLNSIVLGENQAVKLKFTGKRIKVRWSF